MRVTIPHASQVEGLGFDPSPFLLTMMAVLRPHHNELRSHEQRIDEVAIV
jgi:hypothetical protein